MRPWAEHLAAAGYSVRVPRLPGHGTSWQDANRTRWPTGTRQSKPPTTNSPPGAPRLRRRAVDGRHAGHPAGRAAGGALAGLVLVNPSYGTERRDARLARVHRLGGAIPAGDRRGHQEARRGRVGLRPHSGRRVRVAAGAVAGDPRRPRPRSPRRCCCSAAARTTSSNRCPALLLQARRYLDDGPRGRAREQLPRGDPGQRRRAIFDGSVEFIRLTRRPPGRPIRTAP